MARETGTVVDIRLELGAREDVRLFRNNNGVLQTAEGDYLTYGLGPGTSDLIGWRSLQITPAMVGHRIAVFTALEVKKKGRRTQKKRLEAQRDFLRVVIQAGGLAAFVTSVEEAKKVLERIPPCEWEHAEKTP